MEDGPPFKFSEKRFLQMPLKQADIAGKVKEIEALFPVGDWKLNGIHIWPIIRVAIWAELSNQSLNLEQGHSTLSVSLRTKILRVLMIPFIWVYHTYKDFKKSYLRVPKGDILVLGDGVSFVKLNNLYFDKFADSLSSLIQKPNVKVVRLDSSTRYFKPRYSHSFFVQPKFDSLLVKAMVKSKLSKMEVDLPKLNEVREILEEFNLGNLLNIKNLRYEAIRVGLFRKYFDKILRRGRYKAAMVICYYNTYGYGLNLAARNLDIPSFDIQHGVQGANHGAYGSWTNIPSVGYNVLPAYFLNWSQIEKTNIDHWFKHCPSHSSVVVGNLFLNFWKQGGADLIGDVEVGLAKIKSNDRPRVLVSLGWDISTEEYIGSTLEAIAKTQQSYLWLVRLHPSMLDEKSIIEKMLLDNGIEHYELEVSSHAPLFSILPLIDVHVTHSSTVTIETRWFDKKTIITDEYGWSLLSSQVEPEYLRFSTTCDEITQSLEELLGETSEKTRADTKYREQIDLLNEMIDSAL